MFSLLPSQVTAILDSHPSLRIASFSIHLNATGWDSLISEFIIKDDGKRGKKVENLELVIVPGEKLVQEMMKGKGEEMLLGPFKDEVGKLGEKWEELRTVEVSVLRGEVVRWEREGAGAGWRIVRVEEERG